MGFGNDVGNVLRRNLVWGLGVWYAFFMRIIILTLLCVFACSAASFAEKLTEQQKLDKIAKELQQSKEKLKKTKAEEQAVLGRLVVIDKELKKTKKNLSAAQDKIKSNQTKIRSLSSDLRETQTVLQQKEQASCPMPS